MGEHGVTRGFSTGNTQPIGGTLAGEETQGSNAAETERAKTQQMCRQNLANTSLSRGGYYTLLVDEERSGSGGHRAGKSRRRWTQDNEPAIVDKMAAPQSCHLPHGH